MGNNLPKWVPGTKHKEIDLPPSWQAWLAKSDDALHVKWANSYANALLAWAVSDDGQKNPNARLFKPEFEFLSEMSGLKKKWTEFGGVAATISTNKGQREDIQERYTEMYTKYLSGADDALINTQPDLYFIGKNKPEHLPLKKHLYEGFIAKTAQRGGAYDYVAKKWMVPNGNVNGNLVIIDPYDKDDIWASVVKEVIHVMNNGFNSAGGAYQSDERMKKVLGLFPNSALSGFHKSNQFKAWSKKHPADPEHPLTRLTRSTAHEVFANELRFSADESYDLPQSASGGYYPHSASVFDANGYYPPSPYGYALPGMAAPQDPVSALMPIVLVLLLCVCTAVCGFVVCCAGTVCGYVSRKYVGIEMSQMRSKNLRGGVGDEADLQV